MMTLGMEILTDWKWSCFIEKFDVINKWFGIINFENFCKNLLWSTIFKNILKLWYDPSNFEHSLITQKQKNEHWREESHSKNPGFKIHHWLIRETCRY